MVSFALILTHLLTFASLASCQCSASFTNPPPQRLTWNDAPLSNPVYKSGERLTISWTATGCSSSFDLRIWQNINGSNSQPVSNPNSIAISRTSFVWDPIRIDGGSGAPSFSTDTTVVFFFQIWEAGQRYPIATTTYFNITNTAVASTSSSSTSSTSSISSTSSSATTSPSTSASSASSSSSSSLSTPAKIGLGVGITLGVLLLIASIIGIFMCMRIHKQQQRAAAPPEAYADAKHDPYKTGSPLYSDPRWSAQSPVPPSEVDGMPRSPVELPSTVHR